MKKNTDLEKTLSVIGDITWKIIKFFLKVAMWFLWLFIAIFIGTFCMAFGIEMPDLFKKQRNNEIKKEIERDFETGTTDKVLQKYKKLKEVAASTPSTSRESQILQKITNSPGKLLKDVLTEEEMKILFMMLLKSFGLT